ncbi:MAG TPA: hypothetical protein VGD80_05680, partial [Kofleriaceae bacterium]
RAMLFAFDAGGVDEILAYLVSLWVPVVGSFGLVELVLTRTRTRTRIALPTWRTHEAPVDARHPHLLPYDLRRAHGG